MSFGPRITLKWMCFQILFWFLINTALVVYARLARDDGQLFLYGLLRSMGSLLSFCFGLALSLPFIYRVFFGFWPLWSLPAVSDE